MHPPYKFEGGTTIGFIQLSRPEDGFVFTGMRNNVVFVYHTGRALKMIPAVKTSDDNPVSIPPFRLKDDALAGLQAIFRGWTKALSQLESRNESPKQQ